MATIKIQQKKEYNNRIKDPITSFLQSFIELCPEINNEELVFLKEEITITNYKKKDIYLSPNTIQKSIGFIEKGLIRTYYLEESGKIITTAFNKEREYVTDYLAFVKQINTKYYFECLEDCVIISLPFTTIQNGYKRYRVFEKYGRLIAEQALESRINRVDNFLFNDAEKRYLKFIHENPELITRVSLTHLATYLGIERQSLTRIRKKLNGM